MKKAHRTSSLPTVLLQLLCSRACHGKSFTNKQSLKLMPDSCPDGR